MGSLTKTFFSLFCLFIVGFLVIGFLLPRENAFSVTKTISASPEKIFPMINNMKNWELWSPWKESDPNMTLIYSENAEGKDAWYSWKCNEKVNYGKLTILDSKPNQKIETLLNYEDQVPAKGSFVLTPTENGTDVTWSIELQSSKNPVVSKLFGGYGYLMMKFFLGKDFEKGLENLNKTCQ
jgi:hypothetical protein